MNEMSPKTPTAIEEMSTSGLESNTIPSTIGGTLPIKFAY